MNIEYKKIIKIDIILYLNVFQKFTIKKIYIFKGSITYSNLFKINNYLLFPIYWRDYAIFNIWYTFVCTPKKIIH